MSASPRPAGAWGRGRLLLMLGVALLVVVVLVAGVVFAGTYAVTGSAPGRWHWKHPRAESRRHPASCCGTR